MKLNLILSILLIASLLLLHKQCKTSSTLRESTATEVKKWQDEAGFWRASSRIIQREKNALNSELIQLHQDYQKLVDSKKIRSGTEITTETKRQVVLVYDTLDRYKFNDKYLSANLQWDSKTLNLFSRDSLSLVKYDKWQGLFKGRKYTSEIVSHNPYTIVTGVRTVEFIKPNRIVPVIYIGFGANQDGLGWQIGGGIGWRVFK